MVLIALIACGLGITMAFPTSDGIANVTDRSATSEARAVKNPGMDCWFRCAHKSGPCNNFCGSGNYCCRQGFRWREKGCDGKVGGKFKHECTSNPGKKQAECHKLKLRTKSWGQEISWKFGSCQSPKGYGQNIYGKYANYRVYTINCCQPAGTYELDCKDRYGDGWHGGSIEIGGKQYCKDFIRGYSKKQRVQHSKRSARTGTCATVYWHWRYRGSSRTVRVGESTRWVGYHWNDKVSSLRVTPGCTFVGYEHSHYRGQRYTYTRSSYWVGSSRNDKFSSWTCRC